MTLYDTKFKQYLKNNIQLFGIKYEQLMQFSSVLISSVRIVVKEYQYCIQHTLYRWQRLKTD